MPSSPALNREMAVRACACATSYCASAVATDASADARTVGSGICSAAVRACANPRSAASSACCCCTDTSAPGIETTPLSAASASACWAWRSCSSALGLLIRRSGCPADTCCPSWTYSSAMLPSAGEVRVAVALAVTVAAASTTSITSPVATRAVSMTGSSPPEHAISTALSATARSTPARAGDRTASS